MAFDTNSYNAVVGGRHALVMEFTVTEPFLTTAKFSFGGGSFGQPRLPNVGTIDQAEFLIVNPGGGGATTLRPVFTYRYVGPLDVIPGGTFQGPAADYVNMGPFRFSLRPDNLTIGLFCAPNLDADLIAGQTLKMIFTIFDRPGGDSDGSGEDGVGEVVGDTVPVPIPAPTTLTAAYVASDPVYVAGRTEVDWAMLCTNGGLGPVTQTDVQFEYALTDVPGANDWTPFQTEAIAAGVSTPSTYEVQQPVPAAPFTRSWTTRVRGLWMRMLVKAAVGDPTDSIIALSALRRV